MSKRPQNGQNDRVRGKIQFYPFSGSRSLTRDWIRPLGTRILVKSDPGYGIRVKSDPGSGSSLIRVTDQLSGQVLPGILVMSELGVLIVICIYKVKFPRKNCFTLMDSDCRELNIFPCTFLVFDRLRYLSCKSRSIIDG